MTGNLSNCSYLIVESVAYTAGIVSCLLTTVLFVWVRGWQKVITRLVFYYSGAALLLSSTELLLGTVPELLRNPPCSNQTSALLEARSFFACYFRGLLYLFAIWIGLYINVFRICGKRQRLRSEIAIMITIVIIPLLCLWKPVFTCIYTNFDTNRTLNENITNRTLAIVATSLASGGVLMMAIGSVLLAAIAFMSVRILCLEAEDRITSRQHRNSLVKLLILFTILTTGTLVSIIQLVVSVKDVVMDKEDDVRCVLRALPYFTFCIIPPLYFCLAFKRRGQQEIGRSASQADSYVSSSSVERQGVIR